MIGNLYGINNAWNLTLFACYTGSLYFFTFSHSNNEMLSSGNAHIIRIFRIDCFSNLSHTLRFKNRSRLIEVMPRYTNRPLRYTFQKNVAMLNRLNATAHKIHVNVCKTYQNWCMPISELWKISIFHEHILQYYI